MSFILDALKKSESDRQGKSRPERAHIPTGTEKSSSSRWLSIVGVLLLINVVVLLIVFLKPDPMAVDQPPGAIADDKKVEQPDSFKELVANAREGQVSSPSNDAARIGEAPPSTALPTTQEKVSVTEPARTASTFTGAYKTFNEVRANGSVQLPDLHLDLHVFNGTPGERFVFINMSKYGENATLEEGPLVAEIVPEGVILEFTGTRFLLPRE
jgi:hypothetical protein